MKRSAVNFDSVHYLRTQIDKAHARHAQSRGHARRLPIPHVNVGTIGAASQIVNQAAIIAAVTASH